MNKSFKVVSMVVSAMMCSAVPGLFAQQGGNNQYATNLEAGQYSCVPGPHDRTWTSANGHRIVEMATGMNYWDGQQWSPSIASFQISQDKKVASATNIQHKVWLNSDLNTNGAVSVITPDGLTLNSTPVAIALYDAASGNFATIASITNCTGFLLSSNKIVYSNAFVGLCADVIYTLDRCSFQQDVVIKGHLNPADFGFPSNTTRIQILTEFYQPPRPDVVVSPIRVETNQTLRESMASPDFMDRKLGFGSFVLCSGRAYTAASTNPGGGAMVGKQFVTITNQSATRTFLIESVEYPSIRSELDSLPDCDGQLAANGGKLLIQKAKLQYAVIPSPHTGTKTAAVFVPAATKLAGDMAEKPVGLVIDYEANISGAVGTASTLKGDTTYFVSGTTTYNGSLTIEGGAVIKYPTNSVSITLNGSLTLNTSSYRPAVFTAADDNSVGDIFTTSVWAGYTGTIRTNGYGNPDLLFGFGFSGTLSNLRFSYAKEAVRLLNTLPGDGDTTPPPPSVTLSHSQFINCILGLTIYGSGSGSGTTAMSVSVNNCLMANVQSVVSPPLGAGTRFQFNHCTLDNSPVLLGTNFGSFVATNCIFANSSTSSNVFTSSANNGFYNFTAFGSAQYTAGGFPFQTVGSGNYYLTDASGFRGIGTNNMNATLLSQLQRKTTYPPLIMANAYCTNDTTLYPFAVRDINSKPDLGFHYDPIDVAFGTVFVTNATVTVTPGTVIAAFDTNLLCRNLS